ncbi:MAG TPA: hypothetical protein VF521_02515, partial [Pyrinomonadaceae bacterium]
MTERLLLRPARVVLPERVAEGASVLVEGGRISRVYEGVEGAAGARVLDLEGLTLYPGFIDVHIHGAVGVDTLEAGREDLHRVALFLAREGVTAWLPTLVPAPDEDYGRAVASVEELMRAQDEAEPAARAVGVHYEGPFVNERQCGALRTPYFRRYAGPHSHEGLATLTREGAAHMTTLAPEVEGGIELIEELV